MENDTKPIRWWVVTKSGAAFLGVLVLILSLFCVIAIRKIRAEAARDRAEIEKTISEANEFAQRIGCIGDKTWMLTDPEAIDAEVQQRLAAAGLAAKWVDPAVLRRLEAAKACP